MSELVALLSGLMAVGGSVWWVRSHVHPDLVPRTEFDMVLERLTEIRADIRDLRERLDRLAETR